MNIFLSAEHSGIIWMNRLSNYFLFTFISKTNIHVYRKTSNIRRPWAGNEIVDHSDVVGVSPVGDASTTSSFST